MVLLFREALRIEGGDKKRAVGLLDEAIRVPYAWIKSIPRDALPGSLALDNFLLPGNKEDGADKSRHWNVFGGICLYKSPREALELALEREMQDLRDGRYSEPAALPRPDRRPERHVPRDDGRPGAAGSNAGKVVCGGGRARERPTWPRAATGQPFNAERSSHPRAAAGPVEE